MTETAIRMGQRVLYYFSFVVLAGFLYYIIFWRRSFVRYDGRIPFIWDPILNRTLRSYVNTHPSRNILAITGPARSGKSRAMNIVADGLGDKRLVIVLDGGAVDNEEQLLKHIKSQIQSASGTNMTLYHFLCDNLTLTEDSIAEFIGRMESIATAHNPVVFVHRADSIKKYSNAYDIALAKLVRRNQYKQFVPVVIEVQNTLNILNHSSSIRVEYTTKFTDALNEFVVFHQLFSTNEYNKIMNQFGGDGGVYESVFENLKTGMSFDDCIQQEYQAIQRQLQNYQNKTYAKLLKRIVKGTPFSDEFRAIDGLFERGLLYINSNGIIETSNKAVLHRLV